MRPVSVVFRRDAGHNKTIDDKPQSSPTNAKSHVFNSKLLEAFLEICLASQVASSFANKSCTAMLHQKQSCECEVIARI